MFVTDLVLYKFEEKKERRGDVRILGSEREQEPASYYIKHTFGRSSTTMTLFESVREPPPHCEEATIWRNCQKKKKKKKKTPPQKSRNPKV